MTDIVEDYLRELESRLRVEPARKQQIVNEIRGHLRENLAERRAADPSRSEEETAREAIAAFGSPADVALAYSTEGEPAPPGARTGGIALRIGRAVGRGTKAFLKGVAVTLAVLLVVGICVGAWAYYEFKPVLQRNLPYPVYEVNEFCDHDRCTVPKLEKKFFVYEEAREVRMEVAVDHATSSRSGYACGAEGSSNATAYPSGRITVRIADPGGAAIYERTFSPAEISYTREQLSWAPARGNWTIAYEFDGFCGSFRLEVYAIGLPGGAVPRQMFG